MRVVQELIGDQLGSSVAAIAPVSGGDVAESFRVTLDDGRRVFAKTHAAPPPGFFSTEAAGLQWLSAAGAINVPGVLVATDEPPLLVLEWIDTSTAIQPDERRFGQQLANLHRCGAEVFGRSDARTTGSRALPNEPCDTWTQFFAMRRLEPLARLAHDGGVLSGRARRELLQVIGRLDDLAGPQEPPSRLHGDLWAGNRLVDTSGESWLIDPACFGGHREFDLAMMKLFGGFGADAFASYIQVTPLADDWQARLPLWQLAPLLVHAIKFGGSYVPACEQIISRFA